MCWYHFLALLAIVLSVPLYGYVLVLIFCALLAIVLSVPLYGYVLEGQTLQWSIKHKKMIPKHSRIEGQTIQWPIKPKNDTKT
jgi:hypothetical protein